MSSLNLVAAYDSDSESDVLTEMRPAKNARLVSNERISMESDDDSAAPTWSLSAPPTMSLSPVSLPRPASGVGLVLPNDAAAVYGPLWTASPTPCPSPSSSSVANDWSSGVSGRAAALRSGNAIPSLASASQNPVWPVAAATTCFDAPQHASLVVNPWFRAKRTRPPPSASAPGSGSVHASAPPGLAVSPLLSIDLSATALSSRTAALGSMSASAGFLQPAVDPARRLPPPPPPSPMQAAAVAAHGAGHGYGVMLPPSAVPAGKLTFAYPSSSASAVAAAAAGSSDEPALQLRQEDYISSLGPLVRSQQEQLLSAFCTGVAM